MPNASRRAVAATFGRRVRRLAPARTGADSSIERVASGRPPAARSSSRRSTVPVTCCGSRDASATCARSRRGRRCADSVASTCATRGCACSSTATRRTPARTRAGRRPRWPSCPTSSRRSARGTCRAGCGRLGDALHERAARTAAYACCTGAEVVEVRCHGGRVAGSRSPTARGSTPTSWCPTPTRRICIGDLVTSPLASAARAPAAARDPVAVRLRAAAGARGRTPGLRHHTVLFPEDYDAEFDAIFGRDARRRSTTRRSTSRRLTTRRCVPTARARRGSCSSTRRATAPARDASTGMRRVSRDSYADRILAVMARPRAGRPRPAAVARDPYSGRPRAATRSPGGAIYGTSSNGARAAFLRPANRSPVPGLFLVGGSAHPGGGLPLVGLSAAIVADLIGRA